MQNLKLTSIFVLLIILFTSTFSNISSNAYNKAAFIQDGGIYFIKNKNSGRYLDVNNGTDSNGRNVAQWNYNGSNAQKWKVVHVGNGLYKLVSQVGSKRRVLDVRYNNNNNKTNIDIWSDGNSPERRFRIVLNRDGYSYRILSKCSNFTKGVTVQGASCQKGANVFQYQYNASENDEWIFERADKYSIEQAVNYAKKNYNKRSHGFPNIDSIGGDCANFVSQCLLSGGIKHFTSDWWIYKNNNSYLKPNNSYQLDYSWSLADPSPWISAKEFNNFWSNRVSSEIMKGSDILKNKKNILNKPFYVGDVVQILNSGFFGPGAATHTMFITGYNQYKNIRCFSLTYHSTNTVNKNFIQIVEENKNKYFQFFKFR